MSREFQGVRVNELAGQIKRRVACGNELSLFVRINISASRLGPLLVTWIYKHPQFCCHEHQQHPGRTSGRHRGEQGVHVLSHHRLRHICWCRNIRPAANKEICTGLVCTETYYWWIGCGYVSTLNFSWILLTLFRSSHVGWKYNTVE